MNMQLIEGILRIVEFKVFSNQNFLVPRLVNTFIYVNTCQVSTLISCKRQELPRQGWRQEEFYCTCYLYKVFERIWNLHALLHKHIFFSNSNNVNWSFTMHLLPKSVRKSRLEKKIPESRVCSHKKKNTSMSENVFKQISNPQTTSNLNVRKISLQKESLRSLWSKSFPEEFTSRMTSGRFLVILTEEFRSLSSNFPKAQKRHDSATNLQFLKETHVQHNLRESAFELSMISKSVSIRYRWRSTNLYSYSSGIDRFPIGGRKLHDVSSSEGSSQESEFFLLSTCALVESRKYVGIARRRENSETYLRAQEMQRELEKIKKMITCIDSRSRVSKSSSFEGYTRGNARVHVVLEEMSETYWVSEYYFIKFRKVTKVMKYQSFTIHWSSKMSSSWSRCQSWSRKDFRECMIQEADASFMICLVMTMWADTCKNTRSLDFSKAGVQMQVVSKDLLLTFFIKIVSSRD